MVSLDVTEHQEVITVWNQLWETPTQTMKIHDDANINVSKLFMNLHLNVIKFGVVENVF